MTLYTLSIRRPVLAIVMSITIVLFGLLGYSFLGVREFPSLDPPIITVSTSYRGASADVIESQITEPLEASVNAVDGIRTLTSTSRDGRSTIQAEFDLETDLERAANDVRDQVSRAMRDLPPDVDPPIVSKADADARPIAGISVGSDSRTLLELSRIAEETFVERLQTIPNVASVDIWGEKTYSMRLWIDPHKLAAYRLSPIDVRDAVARENVELPSGRIEGVDVELPVRTMSRLDTPEDFNNLILKSETDRIVRLRDVGHAELGPRNERTVLKRNGIPMVLVVVRPQPGANYIAIADEFRRRVDVIQRGLPADIEVSWAFDASRFIRQSVAEVRQTILVAFGLVMLIIFLFLRDWRTTVIPLLVIPVSLIGSGFVMYVAGFSLNVLTLLALVLAIGLVVDAAIVVVEVIYAKIEAGREPMSAGIEGTREVAVFMPILFLGGLVGRLFREFGVTLAGAVIISSFTALTLTPMLATRLLKKRQRHPWLYRATEPFFRALASSYRGAVTEFVRRRWLALPIILVCLGAVALFLDVLPRELAPIEDRGSISISTRGPEGATFAYMDRFMDRLNALIQEEVPESDTTITVTSPGFGAASAVNSGFGRITLVEPDERERTHLAVAHHRRRQAPRSAGPVRDPGAEHGGASGDSAAVRRGGGGGPDVCVRRCQPQVRQARAEGHDRPGAGAGPRHLGPPHRPDPAARVERAAVGLLRHGRQAVRGHRPGGARFPRRNRRSSESIRELGGANSGGAGQAGDRHGDEQPTADLPLRPLRVGDPVGRPDAGKDDRRRNRGDGADRGEGAR
jgi:multidrug efflux pump